MFIYNGRSERWARHHAERGADSSGKTCWVYDCGGFFYVYRDAKPDENRFYGRMIYEAHPR